ncbi:hypothetical protein HPP92_014139 [Vanilla planifolia]|nr:hypothetical protein HPP92_014139 [Vanilla planifolia]
MERSIVSQRDLPGFRFHPTEEELLDFYLRRTAAGKKLAIDIIGTLNLYLYDPWDLPAMAKMGEREWYFFVPRDRRQGNGGRPNRTTERGFWKATGSDRPVRSAADPRRLIGLKKTLVFYRGRAPRGTKTDWVMNEYRLPDIANASPLAGREDIVLCKVYRKAKSMKELEQRAATRGMKADAAETSSGHETVEAFTLEEADVAEVSSPSLVWSPASLLGCSTVDPVGEWMSASAEETQNPPKIVAGRQPQKPAALEVPSANFDLTFDPFMNQLRSPWLERWSPFYNQLINF